MKKIYLDHASTTYLIPEVIKAMRPYYEGIYGNPGSIHQEGRKAKYAIFQARKKIAQILNCQPTEIIFTGSGTESCNLAILGIAERLKSRLRQKASAFADRSRLRPTKVGGQAKKGGHIITSQIEHSAILQPCQKLEKEGFEVTYLPVTREGIVRISDLEKALKPETILVSIMYANNEIGTIQPLKEVVSAISAYRKSRMANRSDRQLATSHLPFFHTDACQAAGFLDLDVKKLGVDLLSLNGSKIYGPKGVGLLFLKEGVQIEPQILGGGQEGGLRGGTENVAGIMGLAKALEIAQKNRIKESARLKKLRDYLIAEIQKKIPKVFLNGHPQKRLPNNINLSILDIEGEAALLWLDKYGISASTGSACDSRSLEPSHVILALGRPYEYAHGSLRFSLGKKTKKEDIDFLLKVLPKIVKNLRAISSIRIKT